MPFHIGNWKLEIVEDPERSRRGNYQKFKRAFTLIELLVVMTIIGILAGLLLASYGGVQQKARDTTRKSDLAQMKRALELAKGDCQGSAFYPYLGGANRTAAYTNLANYLVNSNLKYISSAPKDPQDPTQQYGYDASSDGTNICPDPALGAPNTAGSKNYLLSVTLERGSDADATASRTKCSGNPYIANYNASPWYVVCNN